MQRILPSLIVALAFVAAPLRADERIELRAQIEPEQPFVGEVFVLRLELYLGAGLVREQIVARTLRRLALPAQWTSGLAGLAGIEVLAPLTTTGTDATVLDGAVVRGTWLAADESGEHFVLELAARALEPVHVQCVPRIELAVAGLLATDVFGTSVPTSVATLSAAATALDFAPRPLPVRAVEPGAAGDVPVGVFTLTVAPPVSVSVAADASLILVATVRGARNLDRVPEPTLELGGAFHQVGALTERSADQLVVRYELVPLEGGAMTTPRAILDVFDPTGAGRYVRLASERFPLEVEPTSSAAVDAASADVVAGRGPTSLDRSWLRNATAALSALAVAALIVAVTTKRRRAKRDETLGRLRDFETACANGGPVAAFGDYIAEVTKLPAGARQGTRLVAALEARGCDTPLAQRVAHFIERDVVARYGGAATDPLHDESSNHTARELVRAIEAAQRPAR